MVDTVMSVGALDPALASELNTAQLNAVILNLGIRLAPLVGPVPPSAGRLSMDPGSEGEQQPRSPGTADLLEFEDLLGEIDRITSAGPGGRAVASDSEGEGPAPRAAASHGGLLHSVSWEFRGRPQASGSGAASAAARSHPAADRRWRFAAEQLLGVTWSVLGSGKANDHTLAALFEALNRCGLSSLAAREYGKLLDAPVARAVMGPVSASAALKACSRDIDTQLQLFERVLAAGVEVNEVVYHTVFTACAEGSRLSEALALLSLMRDEGSDRARPDVATFMQLLKTVERAKAYQEAFKIYLLMKEVLGALPSCSLLQMVPAYPSV